MTIERHVAQGGDVGAGVTDAMGHQAPEGLLGIHTDLLVSALGGPQPTNTDEERDSPVSLAAFMLDHDTDSYDKIARAFVDGQPSGNLTRDHILDNITLHWLTGTGASAARSYWDNYGVAASAAAAARTPTDVAIPVGFTTFPGEIWRTPRSWAEQAYPTLSHFNEVDRGGHFAAWEEPERRLSNVVCHQLVEDRQRRTEPEPGSEGHAGATTRSRAAGSNPDTGASDKSLPGPADLDATRPTSPVPSPPPRSRRPSTTLPAGPTRR